MAPLSPLFHSIRGCRACPLVNGCQGPVPGHGNTSSKIMLIGEAPGEGEDESGLPFTGRAGRYLNSILARIGVPRDSVFVTNVVKCHPARDRGPSGAEIDACLPWLEAEMEMIDPSIVVLMGRVAASQFLGQVTMEQVSGMPFAEDVDGHILPANQVTANVERIYLPIYHPAAGLHDPKQIRRIEEGFSVLSGLVSGKEPSSFWRKDEHPSPTYSRVDSLTSISSIFASSPVIAIDTETLGSITTYPNREPVLWSVQVCPEPGTSYFIPAEIWKGWETRLASVRSLVVFHHYLFDCRFLRYLPPSYADTMIAAYLLGLPQGLKELAARMCGMEMMSYEEVTRSAWKTSIFRWLTEAASREWPDSSPVSISEWKDGKKIIRAKKRRPLIGKLRTALRKAGVPRGDPVGYLCSLLPEEKAVLEREIGPLPIPSLAEVAASTALTYACRDADATLRLWKVLEPMMEESGLGHVFWNMEMPLLPMVRAMMDRGMAVDLGHFRYLSSHFRTEMDRIAESVGTISGVNINPNSPKQVGGLVYGKLGFTPTAYTPVSGSVSTDDRELGKIDHPVIAPILEYRRLSKLVGTYCDPVLEHAISREGLPRISSTIRTTSVDTGRLSMSEPLNLQSVPVRRNEGKMVRDGYISPPEHCLLSADYSQIEMRVMAHVSGCRRMVEMFREGRDIHTENAASVFGISLSEAAEDRYRYPAKTLGFGIIYEIGAYGLRDQLREYGLVWSEEECARFIERFYRLHPEIRAYQSQIHKSVQRDGYVRDLFGRMRYIPEAASSVQDIRAAGFRKASNAPIQMGAQGIIKSAMAMIWPRLPDWRAYLLLQIHDSLEFEVASIYARGFAAWVRPAMESAVGISVPLVVSMKSGERWGSMVKEE